MKTIEDYPLILPAKNISYILIISKPTAYEIEKTDMQDKVSNFQEAYFSKSKHFSRLKVRKMCTKPKIKKRHSSS